MIIAIGNLDGYSVREYHAYGASFHFLRKYILSAHGTKW